MSSTSSSPSDTFDLTFKIRDSCYSRLTSSFPYTKPESPVRFQFEVFDHSPKDEFIKIRLNQYRSFQSPPPQFVYYFSIVNAKGEKCRTIVGLAKCKNTSSGSHDNLAEFAIPKKLLTNAENNSLLVKGELQLCCEIKLLPSDAVIRAITSNEPIPTSLSIAEHFGMLLGNGKCSDVVLLVDGQQLKVHKAILSRSPVFAAMFDDNNSETQDSKGEANQVEIVLSDIDLQVCQAFLQYLYTDKVDSMDCHAWELLSVADKYQLDCLRSLCEQYLSSKLKVYSVTDTLVKAETYRANVLKDNCIKFIIENAHSVKDSEGWTEFVHTRPDLLALLFDKLAMSVKQIRHLN